MRTFTCDEARARLSDALAGDIPRPDAHVVEAHLLDCEACKAAAGDFLWQDRVIAELAAQARMDVLLKNVREGLDKKGPLPFEERPAVSLRPWRWVAAAALFIGAICAVVFWKPAVPPAEVASHPAVEIPKDPPVTQIPVKDTPPPQPEIKENPQPIQPLPPPSELVIPAPVKKPVVDAPPKENPQVVKETAPVTPPELPARAPSKERVKEPIIDIRVRNVDDAVRVGTAFLRAKSRDDRFDELLLWTYLHTGVPESEADFQRLLKTVLEKKLERTYNVALLAMALEKLDAAKYQGRIHQCAQFLVDNQCQNGQWSYGAPSLFVEEIPTGTIAKASPSSGGSKKPKDFSEPQPKRPLRKIVVQKKREGPPSGDNSNSMYAALGLRACHDADILLPQVVVDLAAKSWRDSQSRGESAKGVVIEGWCYDGRGAHKPYGSMTAGGVGSLVIYDYIRGRDWKRSREVNNGIDWLARNFSVDYNPGPYEHGKKEENSQAQFFYYMYALERAAILFGTDTLGRHDWYAKGKNALLESQRLDGGWAGKEGGNEVSDTCFALLFLRKATRALIDVPTSSPKK